jgi:hypothetical protein
VNTGIIKRVAEKTTNALDPGQDEKEVEKSKFSDFFFVVDLETSASPHLIQS